MLFEYDTRIYSSAILLYGRQREKMYLMTSAPGEDSDQRLYPCSLISLRCPSEDALFPWLSAERPAKTNLLLFVCLCLGFMAQSIQQGHAELGQFT